MKTSKTLIALVFALAGLTAASSAFAWNRYGPRVSIGFGFGYPAYSYPYYYPPYAYYPPYYPAPVVLQRPAVTYVEQNPQPAPAAQPSAPAAPSAPSGYWYYCADSNAYYPYARECPAGWQRVAPQPG